MYSISFYYNLPSYLGIILQIIEERRSTYTALSCTVPYTSFPLVSPTRDRGSEFGGFSLITMILELPFFLFLTLSFFLGFPVPLPF